MSEQERPPELKPCPFCGAIYHHGVDYDGSHQIDVGCAGGCEITPRVCGSDDPDAEENEQWAIEVWNTRASAENGERVAELLASLTDDQRLELFNRYCKSCGTDNPSCQCWNDD